MADPETTLNKRISNFSTRLSSVPETQNTAKDAKKNPLDVGKTYLDYLRIVRSFVNLSDKDISTLNEANDILQRNSDQDRESASKMTTGAYLDILGEKKDTLVGYLLKATDPKSDVYQRAIEDLSSMMEEGHKLSQLPEKPKDGDPKWDKVIWSHTQIKENQSEAVKHVVIGHFLERTMSNLLEQTTGEKPEKDSFLAAITNVVILSGLRDENLKPILELWSRPKDKGGLGWASQDRISAVKKASDNTNL